MEGIILLTMRLQRISTSRHRAEPGIAWATKQSYLTDIDFHMEDSNQIAGVTSGCVEKRKEIHSRDRFISSLSRRSNPSHTISVPMRDMENDCEELEAQHVPVPGNSSV
jgi:hypothetical protein